MWGERVYSSSCLQLLKATLPVIVHGNPTALRVFLTPKSKHFWSKLLSFRHKHSVLPKLASCSLVMLSWVYSEHCDINNLLLQMWFKAQSQGYNNGSTKAKAVMLLSETHTLTIDSSGEGQSLFGNWLWIMCFTVCVCCWRVCHAAQTQILSVSARDGQLIEIWT